MAAQTLSTYWETILNAVSDGLMVVGKNGDILLVNTAMERMTGFSKEELVGSSCSILKCDVCEIVRSESKKGWCALFEVGEVKDRRCLMTRKDGSYAPALKNARLLEDENGRIIGALETFVDLSEMDRRDQKIEELSRLLAPKVGFHGMIGKNQLMQKIYQIIEKAGQSDAPVIIYGESGTGKELVAHAIHELGRRKENPFIQFNCAALNESLLESELFGHVKGAFTGAYRHRVGRFEAAHGGDIFLDEIGDVPLTTQAKLLRVLESKSFERVGDHQPVRVDVRVISATNRNLQELVSNGKFREDLFFRINVIPIHLPPLRDRKEDIPLLVGSFMNQLRKMKGINLTGVSPEVMQSFINYDWPGNIRELKGVLEYASVVVDTGMIEPDHLPASFADLHKPREVIRTAPKPAVHKDEKSALVEALRMGGGNKSRAAEILGVHRMTVWNRMKKYGISMEKVIKKDS